MIPGKKFPLSMGIKSSKYEVVLLTDADCVPASEYWIQKMQEAYTNGVEVVLGYGAYHKKPGLLNKLIRFETFQSALQFLSFALAWAEVLGVERDSHLSGDVEEAEEPDRGVQHQASERLPGPAHVALQNVMNERHRCVQHVTFGKRNRKRHGYRRTAACNRLGHLADREWICRGTRSGRHT